MPTTCELVREPACTPAQARAAELAQTVCLRAAAKLHTREDIADLARLDTIAYAMKYADRFDGQTGAGRRLYLKFVHRTRDYWKRDRARKSEVSDLREPLQNGGYVQDLNGTFLDAPARLGADTDIFEELADPRSCTPFEDLTLDQILGALNDLLTPLQRTVLWQVMEGVQQNAIPGVTPCRAMLAIRHIRAAAEQLGLTPGGLRADG